MCFSYKSNKNPQTVKLSLGSSVGHIAATPLPSRYANNQTPMRPNRPHISSLLTASKSDLPTKALGCDNCLAIPVCLIFRFSGFFQWLAPPSVPVTVTVRFGEGYLRLGVGTRKRENHPPSHFFHETRLFYKIWGLLERKPQVALQLRNNLAALRRDSHGFAADQAVFRCGLRAGSKRSSSKVQMIAR